jgi:hypothetical protein
MKLSYKALRTLSDKYGDGNLIGFEILKDNAALKAKKEDSESLFNELIQSESIISENDKIQISALGQHVLDMMIDPEILVSIKNNRLNKHLRFYVKDAYYLCVLDDELQKDLNDRVLRLEPVPTLREMVSAFAYTLAYEAGDNEEDCGNNDICILARAWGNDGEISNEYSIDGQYNHKNVNYDLVKQSNGDATIERMENCGIADFINMLTRWVLDNLSEMIEREDEKVE